MDDSIIRPPQKVGFGPPLLVALITTVLTILGAHQGRLTGVAATLMIAVLLMLFYWLPYRSEETHARWAAHHFLAVRGDDLFHRLSLAVCMCGACRAEGDAVDG